MADLEQALYSILSADGTVSGLVGTRIYPNVIPQDVSLPAIAYQRISAMRVFSHGGPSCLARPRFQITCLATSYSSAKAVANAVRGALNGYVGTAATVEIQASFIQNEFDTFTDDDDLHTVRQDYYIWQREA